MTRSDQDHLLEHINSDNRSQMLSSNTPTNSQLDTVLFSSVTTTNDNQINLLTTNDSTRYSNERFQKRINDLYPCKRVSFISFLFLISNVFIVMIEYSYSLPLAKVKVNFYGSLISTRYIATTSFINIIYALLAMISTKYKKYFLIQLVAILFVMSFFASFVQLFLFNLFLLNLEIKNNNDTIVCGFACVLAHVLKAAFGFVSALLACVLFIQIQLKFMPLLNNITSTS